MAKEKIGQLKTSKGEQVFQAAWTLYWASQNSPGLAVYRAVPMYSREYRFHPTRDWRLDFAWANLVAVEIEGGTWTSGRHTRGKGFLADCEKYNAATLRGWRILRFTVGQVEADPIGIIDQVVQLLKLADGL